MFARPFLMLMEGKNLYEFHYEYYFDIYKYSPTCALLFGAFQSLPDWLGLFLWNCLNVIVLYTACIRILPVQKNITLLWVIIIDVITSLQNSQSNCLIAGLMLWTYINLDERKNLLAAVCLAFAAFIKIYGIAAGLLIIFYPDRWKTILYCLITFIVFACLPLLFVRFEYLVYLYKNWFKVVGESATQTQLSIMGVATSLFGLMINNRTIQLIGLLTLLLPAFKFNAWQNEIFRKLYLSAILIFVVIFNQMSESPTFIIAITGFYLWVLQYHNLSKSKQILIGLAIIFTSLAASFLFPTQLKDVFVTYKVKAIPMIIAWLFLMFEFYRYSFRRNFS